jgi:cold shock CspA family protein
MAKSQTTFSKKEKEKKKLQKRKDKAERKEVRKANATDGSKLENMMAYVDENGNISSTPPDPAKKTILRNEDIEIGSRNKEGARSNFGRKGRLTFFNTAKGYGFIKDEESQESLFVHSNDISQVLKENDKVIFDAQRGPKGMAAINVKKA